MSKAQQSGLKIIAEYLAKIADMPQGDFCYRGHADENWKLVPSAFRDGVSGIVDGEQLAGLRKVSSRFANPKPQCDLEWLVLAQHYRVPTTLLDWTANPLVALFFAAQRVGVPAKPSGVVLRFPHEAFEVQHKPEKSSPFRKNRKKPAMLDTSAMNLRTLAQDSAMSVHCETCKEMLVSDENIVFEIQHEMKYQVREALKLFGITDERLYADISIAAREYASELDWYDLIG